MYREAVNRPSPSSGPASRDAVLALASIALVAIAASMIVRQSLDGARGYGDVVYDTRFYLAMIDGHWPWDVHAPAAIPAPFRYRILVPWVASLFPTRSGRSLALVTYASLAVSYFCTLLTCRRLGISRRAAVAGLAAAYASYAHLGIYTNPYMTDASGLMIVAAMTYALVADLPWAFAAVGFAGLFMREVTLLFMPAWCVRNVRRGLAFTALAALAIGVEHWIVGAGPASPIVGTGPDGPSPALMDALLYFSRWRLDTRVSFAKEILTSWGWLWLSASVGLALVPADRFRSIGAAAVALLIAGLCSLFIGQDVSRLLNILLPVMAVGTAQLIAVMAAQKQRTWLAFFGLLIVVQFFLSWPNLTRGPRAVMDAAPRLRWIMLMGSAGMMVAIRTLRNELQQGVREKWSA